MEADEFKKQCARLGLKVPDCARLFGYSLRSSSRWAKDGPPLAVAVVLVMASDKKHLIKLIKAAE